MGTVRHPLLIFVTDKSDRINFTMVRIFVMYVVLYLKPPKCTPSMVNLSTNEISAKSTNQLTFRHNRGLIALFVSGIMLKFYFSILFSKVWKQLGRFSLNLVHNFSCMESTSTVNYASFSHEISKMCENCDFVLLSIYS